MNGKIQVNSGDVSIIAVNIDGVQSETIPKKEEGKYFESASCDQGATGSWDRTNWEFKIQNLTKKKTKCTLNFVTAGTPVENQNGASKMEDLLSQEENKESGITIASDDNNIRYIGSAPKNYVYFNCKDGNSSGSQCEKWRIIGLMDNIETSTGTKEKLLKIIRSDSLGNHSWDKSDNGENDGYGVNEWSHADLMHALKKYGGESDSDCKDTSCRSWGQLSASAQGMIENVKWNTGTSPGDQTMWQGGNSPIVQYMWERSDFTGKQCNGGSSCNDNISRKTTWEGKVGLMYPSDYGYATDGGGTEKRESCLWHQMYGGWLSNCYENDWLCDSSNEQWTMTPAPYSLYANNVFYVYKGGFVSYNYASISRAVRPVVYLKSSVKIKGGTGEETSPYELSIN